MNQEGETPIIIKSYFLEKDGIQCFFHHLGTAIEIDAKKNDIWFKSSVIKIQDEDLEFIWKEFEKGEIEIMSVNEFKFKIFAKGFNALLEKNTTNSKELKEILSLKAENYKLSEKIRNLENLNDKIKHLEESQNKSNIVWVTVITDNKRRDYEKGKEVIKFTVDKKKANSILLIDGIICVCGEYNAQTGQTWVYGGKTIAYGQSECYANNSGYGRNVTTKSVISNHNDVGPQELILKWDSRMLPFKVINPNSTDHEQFYDVKTQSVYTVWEINQDN
jgi:hypothetical protein